MAVDPKRDALVDRDGSSCVTSKIDYGPHFDMKPENWDEWQFLAMLHLSNKGFAEHIDGSRMCCPMLLERPRRLALGGPDNLAGGGAVRRKCSEDVHIMDPAHLRH